MLVFCLLCVLCCMSSCSVMHLKILSYLKQTNSSIKLVQAGFHLGEWKDHDKTRVNTHLSVCLLLLGACSVLHWDKCNSFNKSLFAIKCIEITSIFSSTQLNIVFFNFMCGRTDFKYRRATHTCWWSQAGRNKAMLCVVYYKSCVENNKHCSALFNCTVKISLGRWRHIVSQNLY